MTRVNRDFQGCCPRLYAAVQQRRAMESALPGARARAFAEVSDLEWLVAHRDLQLLRSFARTTKRGKKWTRYLRERQAKLDDARRALARALARVPQSWEDMPA